ncbi:PKD domain-containing protein [Desulfonema ishimotonii]|uniref:PKD domain-containing protein n=1 Tax=Desulfonema ishimotonii TaxID=45657 RepID=UPI00350E3FD2
MASTKAGDFTVVATVDGVTLTTKPVVTFTPGTADHILLSTVSGETEIQTDGTDTLEIQASVVDANGNVVEASTDTVTLTLDATTYAAFSGAATASGTVTDGVFTATLTSVEVDAGGPIVITAENAGATLTGGPFNINAVNKVLQTIAIEIIEGGTTTSTSPKVGETVQFKATGTYDDSSTADITNSVIWDSSLTAVGTIDASGLFTAASNTPDNTTVISAASGDVTSNEITLTVQPAAAVVINEALLPTQVIPGDQVDFGAENVVTGGSGAGFDFAVAPKTAGNAAAASIDTAGLLTITDAGAFAGVYTVTVTDKSSGENDTYDINVPMTVDPKFFIIKSSDGDQLFTIKGAPGTDTTFAVTPAAGSFGTFTATVAGEYTANYTPPTDLTTATEFDLTFTATTTAGDLESAGLNVLESGTYKIIPSADFSGVVKDSADPAAPVNGAKIVLVNTGETVTTVADGAFTFADLTLVDNVTYTFNITADGKKPQTVFYSNTNWPTMPVEIVLTDMDEGSGSIAGAVKDATDGSAIKGAEVTVTADGADVGFIVYSDDTGAYSMPIDASLTGATNFIVKATKGGFVASDLISDSGVLDGALLDTPDQDVTLRPATIINISAIDGAPADEVAVTIDANAGANKFDGSANEISAKFTDKDGTPVTLTPDLIPSPGVSDSYIYVYAPNERFTLTVGADVSNDSANRDVTNPESYSVSRDFCYVESFVSAQTGVGAIVNPDINGGTVTSDEAGMEGDVTLVIPPGEILATADRVIDKITVEMFEADSATSGADVAGVLGSANIYQVEIFDATGQLLTDANIGELQLTIKYDPAVITGNAFEAFTTGKAFIYRADDMCTLVTTDLVNSGEFIPTSDILSAENGLVTFKVGKLSAFGVSGLSTEPLPDPTISLSPTSGFNNTSTTVTVTGSNFVPDFLATTPTVTIAGAPVTPTVVDGDTLTFVAPSSGTTGAVVVSVDNGTQTAATANFTYKAVTPPPVLTPPTARFSAVPTKAAVGQEIQFTDESSAGSGITSRTWNFGDGTTSSEQNPTHTYTEAGTYTVKLTLSGPGGSDTETKTNYIEVVVDELEASFIASEANIVVGSVITFQDTSVGAVSRVWKINGTETGDTAASFEYTFSEVGEFTVTLEVTGASGSTATAEATVTVFEAPTADFDFTIADDGLTVTFINKSAGAVSYVWQFGDGASSDAASPVYKYTEASIYNVVLTIADADNATYDITRQVDVPGTDVVFVTADFIAPAEVNVNDAVQFIDKSTATNTTINAWAWAFGDGGTSAEPSPVYTYDSDGTFNVSLTVSDGAGKSDTKVMTITVNAVAPVYPYNPPTLVTPSNGQIDVALMPVMEIGDLPAGTYALWEIALDEAFAEEDLVWRETTSGTTLEIPEFILEAGPTEYYWRVRVVDENGAVKSDWAGPYRFVTVLATEEDQNGNGIPDDQEVDDPASVFPDLDIDSIDHIKFVKAAVGDGVFGLEGKDSVIGIPFLKAFGTDVVSVPSDTKMPWGLIGYKIEVTEAGDTAKVKIHFSEAIDAAAKWLIYKEVAGWQDFSVYSEFSADRKSVTLTLVDGGESDVDGIRNGVIIVPLSGFGIVETVVVKSGGGGSDTCFISAAAQGGFAPGLALITLISAASATLLRRRK